MLKKTIILLILVISTINISFANEFDSKVIKYSLNDSVDVISKSALVQVIGYTTLTSNESINSAKKNLISEVKSSLNDSHDWKVVNLNNDYSKSGAVNLTVYLQDRVTQYELNKLQETLLKDQKVANQKFEINVVSYEPSQKKLNIAKQNLMADMYKQAEDYLGIFNNKANSDFKISEIDYKENNKNISQYRNNSPYGAVKLAAMNTNQNSNIVTTSIKLTAKITATSDTDNDY